MHVALPQIVVVLERQAKDIQESLAISGPPSFFAQLYQNPELEALEPISFLSHHHSLNINLSQQ